MTNTLALLDMYRAKGVITATNHNGQVIFFGLRRLPQGQRDVLLAIPQAELKAAMKGQGR